MAGEGTVGVQAPSPGKSCRLGLPRPHAGCRRAAGLAQLTARRIGSSERMFVLEELREPLLALLNLGFLLLMIKQEKEDFIKLEGFKH